MVLIELGNVDVNGVNYWHGVLAKTADRQKVKSSINTLEDMGPQDRVEWFNKNDPKADIVGIETTLMIDRIRGEMKDNVAAVTIDSAAELTWKK
jgi:hypothetical protein